MHSKRRQPKTQTKNRTWYVSFAFKAIDLYRSTTYCTKQIIMKCNTKPFKKNIYFRHVASAPPPSPLFKEIKSIKSIAAPPIPLPPPIKTFLPSFFFLLGLIFWMNPPPSKTMLRASIKMNISLLFIITMFSWIVFLVIFLPMQSMVRALGSEHPCIQAPLKASQPPLHLDEQYWLHPVEYLNASQPMHFN